MLTRNNGAGGDRRSTRRTEEYQKRLHEVNVKQNVITEHLSSGRQNLTIAQTNQQREERQRNALYSAFQTFFSKEVCTLNEKTGDKKILETHYSKVLPAMAKVVRGNGAVILETHRSNYQHFLMSSHPDFAASLPVGYFLFRTHQAGIEQIHVVIAHPQPFEREKINLSESNPPTAIRQLLEKLSWPQQNIPSQAINLDKKLEQWIALCSTQNKTKVRLNDIFWEEETAEHFSQFLSEESRKPQYAQGRERRPLVIENGTWASAVSFFGNGLAWMWYGGSSPRKYGHDTVINQDRQIGQRENEIAPIISAIANQFIHQHIEAIDPVVKAYSQNGMRL